MALLLDRKYSKWGIILSLSIRIRLEKNHVGSQKKKIKLCKIAFHVKQIPTTISRLKRPRKLQKNGKTGNRLTKTVVSDAENKIVENIPF